MDGLSVEHLAIQQGSVEIVADALVGALLDIEAYEEQLPCILICTDLESGEQTFSGPFESRTVGARIVGHEACAAGLDSSLAFSLAPLYPPLELGDAPQQVSRGAETPAPLPSPRDG